MNLMKNLMKRFLAMALCVLSGMSVFAAEETISLDQITFGSWDGWGADAVMTASVTPAWTVGEPTGQPYGDAYVGNFADLSACDKLIIEASDGTPRIMMNRDIAEGQFDPIEANSHLIEYPKCQGTWAEKYFTTEAGEDGHTIYIVNLKQMVKDKGFAHLHAIKGANWTNVTVYSMQVVGKGKTPKSNVSLQQVPFCTWDGWDATALNTGDAYCEWYVGESSSMAYGDPSVVNFADLSGYSKLIIEVTEGAPRILLNRDIQDGQYNQIEDESHLIDYPRCEYDWAGKYFSVNEGVDGVNTYIVDLAQLVADKGFAHLHAIKGANWSSVTVKSMILVPNSDGAVAEFCYDAILLDFDAYTNISELVEASGKQRLVYPMGTVKVTVNDEVVDVVSAEGYSDGRFYIFLEDEIEEEDVVFVSFTNPTNAAYQIIYVSGAMKGQAVKDIANITANYNEELENADAVYAYDYLKPILIKADPEDGSFNLSNSISEFKAWFDKEVKAEQIEATLNGEPLTVSPNTGLATEFTFTRNGDDLATGEYKLHITKAEPKAYLNKSNYCDTTLVLNIGKTELNPDDQEEIVMTDDFAESGSSWIVSSGNDESMQPANSGSGCRQMHSQPGFATDILYLGTRNTPTGGVALYGVAEKKLTLQAKNYHLTLGAAKWDGGGEARTLKVQVLPEAAVDPDNGSVIDENAILVEERKAIEPDFKTSTDATRFDIVIPVTEAGNYVIRLVVGDINGNPAGYNDASAIGDIKVEYLPNIAGLEWIRLLTAALENAKKIRNSYADEAYSGEAFTALNEAIVKYEAEMENYTNPSAYENAANDLNAIAAAMDEYAQRFDTYNASIKKAIDVVRKNEMPNGDPNQATKFVKTELFAQLKAFVESYHGTSMWMNVADTIADPWAEPVWELVYSYDTPKDEMELQKATDELAYIANYCDAYFTEGESKLRDGGVKVLVDRLRRGAETLKALGTPANDDTVVNALDALDDNDYLAQKVKKCITTKVYETLANPDNTLFEPVLDDNFNEVTPTFDMTAFVKNGNIYVNAGEKAALGWDVTGGVGYFLNWGASHDNSIVPEDLAFSIYHAAGRAEQTITDLPAGIYTVTIDAARWDNPRNDDNTWKSDVPECGTFAYIKTGKTPEVEAGLEEDREINFAATETIDYYGQYVMHHDCVFENVEITDGKLVLGVNFASDGGQYFFDNVRLVMTAPATDFDYAEAYRQVIEGQSDDKIWTIAGANALCGASWDPAEASNNMTTKDDVTYTLAKDNVVLEAGVSYEYKVVANHSWDECYPYDDNASLTVDDNGLYSVRFYFNSDYKTLSVEYWKTGDVVLPEKTWTIAGVGAVLGSGWNHKDTANDMTALGDGTYQLVKKSVELMADVEYEFKVLANHSWDENYGMNGEAGGRNCFFTVDEDGVYNVTFVWIYDTKELYAIAEYASGNEDVNYMYAFNGQVLQKGTTSQLSISMQNDESVVAFQFDVVLPQGMSLAYALNDDFEEVPVLKYTNRGLSSHVILAEYQNDGSLRIAGYSSKNAAYRYNDGELLTFGINVEDWVADGDYTVMLKNVLITNAAGVENHANDRTFTVKVGGLKGDANNDGQVTMSDVVAIVNYVLGRANANFNLYNADVNGTGDVTMADVVGVVNIVLGREAITRSRGAEATSALVPGTLTLKAEADRMSVKLDNTAAYTAFQMDVTLPDGISLNNATFTDRQTSSHSLSMNELENGKVRIAGWSARNAELKGNSGELLNLVLSGAQTVGAVTIDNIRFVTAEGVEHAFAAVEAFGETTGITSIENGKSGIENGYDLGGRKVNSKTLKGLYILDGKKSVIK